MSSEAIEQFKGRDNYRFKMVDTIVLFGGNKPTEAKEQFGVVKKAKATGKTLVA